MKKKNLPDTNSNPILNVRNPRTGQNDYRVQLPNGLEIQQKCKSLRQMHFVWQKAGIDFRIEILNQFAENIEIRRQEIMSALTADTGRISESELEIRGVIDCLKRWSDSAKSLMTQSNCDQLAMNGRVISRQIQSAYPLVGVISPWNFPFLLSFIDAVPALLAGCAVIIKPSELTPRFIEPLNKILKMTVWKNPHNQTEEYSLSDICALVPGAGNIGQEIVNNVDAVCFTGSVNTGKNVAASCAQRLIPSFLELGGKDPVILLESADLDLASSAILWGATANAGQSCLSVERVYVQKSAYQKFLELLVKKAKLLKLNDADISEGQIGPIISLAQAEVIKIQLADAAQNGAVLHCGGEFVSISGGNWCLLTVLTNVNHGMKIMTEETFGPILPIIEFQTPIEAISMANDSEFGLSAAVFAGDLAEAQEIATQLEAGAVSVNDTCLTAFVHSGSKSPLKNSGLGTSRMGQGGLLRFLRQQTLLLNQSSVRAPWWHSEAKTN